MNILKMCRFLLLLFTAVFLLFYSCKKQNLDYEYDYRPDTEAGEASNVRLVNLSNNRQVIVDGDTLTNFFVAPPSSLPSEAVPPGTRYFPKDGRLGQLWNFPQELLGIDGKAEITTTSKSWYSDVVPIDVKFTAEEEFSNPKDYYLLATNSDIVEWDRQVVEVPRSVTAPSRPDYFKIRIVNFAAKPTNAFSPMENLVGPMSLTYADGTSVSVETDNIQPGSWSEYVEVPYGTYQFKVLTSDGRQVPSVEQTTQTLPLRIDPQTSTLAYNRQASHITYAPIQSFQPGGVYTIVIHPSDFTWNNGSDDLQDLQNGFHIVADIDEPQNRTYARVQLANALPERSLTLSVNGVDIEKELMSGSASEYLRVVAGKRDLTIKSASGNSTVTLTETLTAGGNYTLWMYPDAQGNATPILVNNNLNGSWFMGSDREPGNAELDRRQTIFPFHFRFLNLCPDIQYLTITNGNGVPFENTSAANRGSTASNLQPGLPRVDNPYTRHSWEQPLAYQFLAYASAPGRLPGDWVKDIPYLSSEALIARKELYTDANRAFPAHEPGIYTIALIGRHQNGTSNAGFMVVKHTK